MNWMEGEIDTTERQPPVKGPGWDRPEWVIVRGSWHHNYYKFLRRIWGLSESDPSIICSYFQLTLWLSVLTVLASPILVVGWLIGKLFRWTYRCCEESNVGKKFTDVLDNFFLAKWMENLPFDENPCVAAFGSFFIFLCIFLIVMIVSLGFSHGIWHLPLALWYAVGWVCNAMLNTGWFLFFAMALVGVLIVKAAGFVAWLFTNGPLWFVVLKWTAIIAAICISSVAVCFSFYLLSKTNLGIAIKKFISLRFNGYKEAREKARQRRYLILREIEEGLLPPSPPNWFQRTWDVVWPKVVGAVKAVKGLFVSRDIDLKGKAATALSPFAIAWVYIVAIKQQACPRLKFVDPEDVQEIPEQVTLKVVANDPETYIQISGITAIVENGVEQVWGQKGGLSIQLDPGKYNICFGKKSVNIDLVASEPCREVRESWIIGSDETQSPEATTNESPSDGQQGDGENPTPETMGG